MSIAAQVELYIAKRPYLKMALSRGVINYTSLAKQISQDKSIDSLGAVKMALSRLEDHLSRSWTTQRDKVEKILDKTEVMITDSVKVNKTAEYNKGAIVMAKTRNGFTEVRSGGDKALISLISPIELETTPGVVEFILSSLAAEGINVDQLISCREDTHLVINRKKAAKTLEVLQERLG